MTCMDDVFPARGRVFLRRVETEDTYRGGRIIVPDQARDKVARQQFIVVKVGNYERCEDPDECSRRHTKYLEHPHRLQINDWVLVRNRAWVASPDPNLYICRQDDVLGVFEEVQPAVME